MKISLQLLQFWKKLTHDSSKPHMTTQAGWKQAEKLNEIWTSPFNSARLYSAALDHLNFDVNSSTL